MALQLFDRVLVTATANTTVSFTLGSAVAGYQSFSVMTNGNTTYYGASDGTNWEVGIGTYSTTGPTLTRTTILSSSNSGSAVIFSGSPNVWIDYPAGKSVYEDASNNVTLPGTITSTGVTTPSVTASSTDLTLSAISTGAINFNTLNGTQVKITDVATGTGQYTLLSRHNGNNTQKITAANTANLALQSTGGGGIYFRTGDDAPTQALISHTISAVNYVQVTGAATTARPVISAQGSDTNVSLDLNAKGVASLRLQSGGTNMMRLSNVASSVNYFDVYSSATTVVPQFKTEGSDTNISMAFQPKGTGAIDLAAGSSGVNISNGGTVTAITRTVQGSGYTSVPSLAISSPTTAGGVQATATANLGVLSATIVSGGTGYTVGNTLTVVGGTGTAAQLTVSTVSSGVITAVTVAAQNGVYSVFPNSPVSVTGGSGSGATFNISGGILSTFTITNAGSGYIEQPTVTFSGGGGSGAAAYARVGSPVTVTALGTQINLNTENGTGFRVLTSGATATDMWQAISNGTTAILRSSNATANSQVQTAGTGALQFGTNNGVTQLQVSHTASAVNYVQVTGAATGGQPTISAQGSDTNIPLQFNTKGNQAFNFYTNGGTQRQFRVVHTASSVNFGYTAGSATGTAVTFGVDALSSDTNIDLALTPKGTGLVRFGTYTAGALTATGYINIKAADGTTYKVLVST